MSAVPSTEVTFAANLYGSHRSKRVMAFLKHSLMPQWVVDSGLYDNQGVCRVHVVSGGQGSDGSEPFHFGVHCYKSDGTLVQAHDNYADGYSSMHHVVIEGIDSIQALREAATEWAD